MDYIKEAENYLRHYASLKKAVNHAKYMIDKIALQACPNGVGAVNNDVTGVSAQHPINTLQEMYELRKWQSVYDESSREIEHIEELLGGMDEVECRLLDMWYVQKMDKGDIAKELGYETRKTVYQIRDKALKNFSVNLFGIQALRVI